MFYTHSSIYDRRYVSHKTTASLIKTLQIIVYI